MAWWDKDWLDWSGVDPSGKDLLDWSGIDPTTTENQIDLANIDINPFDAGEYLELNLEESAEIIADAIAEDPIGTIGTIALTMAGVPPHVIAMVQGANTAARGGSLEDVILSTITTYAGTQIGDIVDTKLTEPLKQALSSQAGGTLAPLNEALANAIGAGTTGVSRVLIHNPNASIEDLARSFTASALSGATLQSGEVETYLNTTLGKIDDVLGLEGSSFANLTDSVQASISAGIATAVSGGDITSSMLEGLVKGYAGIGQDVTDALAETTGMSDAMATLWTQAMGNSLSAAIKGGAEPTDAFFQTFRDNADKGFKEWVNSPDGLAINDKLDSLFGDKEDTLSAASALQTAETNLANATNKLNDLSTDATQFNALASTYNANMTQENLDAFTTKVEEFKTKYGVDTIDSAFFTGQLSSASAARNDLIEPYTTAAGNYEDALGTILSKADDWGTDYLPAFSEADKIAAFTIRPQFDEAAYKEVLGLDDDVNAYEHYLNNQQIADEAIAQSIVSDYTASYQILKEQGADALPAFPVNDESKIFIGKRPTLFTPTTAEGAPTIDTTAPTPVRLADLKDIEKTNVALTGSVKDPQLSALRSTVGQFIVGIPGNLAQMIEGTGIAATALSNEVTDYFSPTGGYGNYDAYRTASELFELSGGAYQPGSESTLEAYLQSAVAAQEDLNLPSARESRMINFSSQPSVVQMGTDYLAARLEDLSGAIEDTVFTEEQQKIISDSGFVGTKPSDLQFAGEDGNLVGAAGTISNEIGGEVLDLLVRGNPFLVAFSGIINAGEAVAGAHAKTEQTINDLYDADILQGTDIYKDAIAYFGDVDEAKRFVVAECLRGQILKVSTVGAVDAVLPGAGSGYITGTVIRAGSEGGQEVAESSITLDEINKVLGLELPIFEDASGNFVMGFLSGAGTQIVGDIGKLTKEQTIDKVFGGNPPDVDSSGTSFSTGTGSQYTAREIEDGLARFELQTGLMNNLTSWGVIPNDPRDSTAAELSSKLNDLGVPADDIVEVGNLVYTNDFVTKTEISNEIKLINPAFNPSEELSAQAYEQFGGNKSQAELDTLLGNFIDPYYFDRDEVKKAAESAGVVLTDEQADEYVGQVENEDEAANETVEALNSLVTNAELTNTVNAAVGTPSGVDENGNAIPATGLHKTIEDATGGTLTGDDVTKAVQDLVGTPADEDAGTEATGLYKALTDTDLDVEAINDILGNPGETVGDFTTAPTGLFKTLSELNNLSEKDVADAVEAALNDVGLSTKAQQDVADIVDGALGSPASVDENGNAVDPTGIYKELADLEAAGLSTNAKSDVEKLIDDVIGSAEEGTGVLGAIDNLNDLSDSDVTDIVKEIVGSAEDNTGLFGALAGLNNLSDQDVKTALEDYVGTPAGVDANNNPVDPTGLYADLGNLSTDIGDVADVLGNPAELDVDGNVVTEPTGVFANFADIDTRLDTIDTVTTNLTNAIGAAAQLGVDSTGLYAYIDSAVQTLKDAGLTQEQVATTVTEIVGSPATDDTAATGIYAELGNLGLDLDSIANTLGTPATDDAASTGLYGYIDTATGKITEDVSALAGTVGKPAVLDEEGNVVEEATGVFADLATLEASGLTRDEAILQLATNLGLQTTTLTTAISDAEGRIRADIGKPAVLDEEGNVVDPSTGVFAGIDTAETRIVELVEQYEADGILRDEALDTAIGNVATDLGVTKEALLDEIGTTKTDLLNALGETETAITGQVAELGLDVDDIARTVGKPARDVTQEDIDLVTGAVEEETQLNAAQVAQFDVDGDGVITFADRDALIGYMSDTDPTQLAATGIYSELDTQTDAFTQLMNTLSTDITTQMTTAQADRDLKQRQSNISDFTQLLAGADDLQGQRTTVTTPDPIGDINPYNFESIFRDAGQAGRYTSPYGGTQATAAQEALDAAPPTQRGNMGILAARLRGGFAQGGQVEDENDMLLRVLGEIR